MHRPAALLFVLLAVAYAQAPLTLPECREGQTVFWEWDFTDSGPVGDFASSMSLRRSSTSNFGNANDAGVEGAKIWGLVDGSITNLGVAWEDMPPNSELTWFFDLALYGSWDGLGAEFGETVSLYVGEEDEAPLVSYTSFATDGPMCFPGENFNASSCVGDVTFASVLESSGNPLFHRDRYNDNDAARFMGDFPAGLNGILEMTWVCNDCEFLSEFFAFDQIKICGKYESPAQDSSDDDGGDGFVLSLLSGIGGGLALILIVGAAVTRGRRSSSGSTEAGAYNPVRKDSQSPEKKRKDSHSPEKRKESYSSVKKPVRSKSVSGLQRKNSKGSLMKGGTDAIPAPPSGPAPALPSGKRPKTENLGLPNNLLSNSAGTAAPAKRGASSKRRGTQQRG